MASLHNMLMAGTVVGDDRIEVKSSFFGLCKTAVYQPTGSKLTAVILEFPQDRAGELNRIMQTPDEELPAVVQETGKLVEKSHYQNYKEMTFITILIIVVFVIGYALIALESATHINKAAVALLMCVACWTLYMVHPADYLPGVTTDLLSSRINTIIEEHLGSISTTLFFLCILMTVACLEEVGVLTVVGQGLDHTFHGNHYLVTGFIGVLSSIVDNVPLVAGCIGMYPLQEAGAFAVDGVFWQLLAYCAGVGGSILIIGSAAGVVAMGLEKISFGWYARHISWAALIGYLAGIVSYYLLRTFVF